MKKLTIFTVLMLCVASVFAQTKTQNISSDIKKVTIFLEGATITREAKITLNPGTTQLVFEDLTTQLDPSSIQAGAGNDVTILSVTHRRKEVDLMDKSARQLRLEDSIESLDYVFQLENINKTSLEEQLALITSNKQITGQNGLNVVQLADALDLYKEQLPKLKKQYLESTRKWTEINNELRKKRGELSLLIRDKQKPFTEVLVTVSVNKRMTVTMELDYYCYNAGWLPKYDIRATDLKSKIELNYKADVLQNTDEDWDDVQITLSSGNPRMSGSAPELRPNYVSTYDPNAQTRTINSNNSYVWRNSNDLEDAAPTMRGARGDGTAFKANSFTPTIEYPLSVEFSIKSLSTVKTGNQASQVDINNFDLDALYKHVAVPKLDCDAFLLAKVVNWEGLNLLSGDANIYFEGKFVGRSFIDAHTNNDTLNLSLGRDKKVVIARNKVKDRNERIILSSKKKQTVTWEIDVRNTKTTPIEIVIEDQIPVSNNSEIEIALLEKSGAEYDEKTGKLIWRLTIPPGENKKISFSFEIKYPKNVNIRGVYTL